MSCDNCMVRLPVCSVNWGFAMAERFAITGPVSVLATEIVRDELTGAAEIRGFVSFECDDDQEAIAIFTDTDLARRYAEDTSQRTLKIATFSNASELCRFLIHHNTPLVAIDPSGIGTRTTTMKVADLVDSIMFQ